MHAPKWLSGKLITHEDKIKEYKDILEKSDKILKNGSSVESISFISTDHNFLLKIQATCEFSSIVKLRFLHFSIAFTVAKLILYKSGSTKMKKSSSSAKYLTKFSFSTK